MVGGSDIDAVSMGDASLCSRCYVWFVGPVLTLQVWVMQVHTAIREDPAPQKKERSKPSETKLWKPKKLTYDERKQKLKVPPSALSAGICAAHCSLHAVAICLGFRVYVQYADYTHMQSYGGHPCVHMLGHCMTCQMQVWSLLCNLLL